MKTFLPRTAEPGTPEFLFWLDRFIETLNKKFPLSGTGVPNVNLGADGNYYFRDDGTAGSQIYFKSGGTWGPIV